jgi:hypothetical protein
MVAAVSAPATHDLKRLGFVSSYAATASHMASSAYAQARAFTPGLVEPFVQQAEETALTLGAPYLALAQDKAEKVLTTVDSTVRSVEGRKAACRPCGAVRHDQQAGAGSRTRMAAARLPTDAAVCCAAVLAHAGGRLGAEAERRAELRGRRAQQEPGHF